MTATYWEIGRRIIEFEQRGATRAEYGGGAAGEAVFALIRHDLTSSTSNTGAKQSLGEACSIVSPQGAPAETEP
jgi:hypothetical protein